MTKNFQTEFALWSFKRRKCVSTTLISYSFWIDRGGTESRSVTANRCYPYNALCWRNGQTHVKNLAAFAVGYVCLTILRTIDVLGLSPIVKGVWAPMNPTRIPFQTYMHKKARILLLVFLLLWTSYIEDYLNCFNLGFLYCKFVLLDFQISRLKIMIHFRNLNSDSGLDRSWNTIQWHDSGVFFLTFKRFHTSFWCFHCSLWTSKYWMDILVLCCFCVCYALHYPNRHLIVQCQQWEHQNNVWNLFKVNNKETRTTTFTVLISLVF